MRRDNEPIGLVLVVLSFSKAMHIGVLDLFWLRDELASILRVLCPELHCLNLLFCIFEHRTLSTLKCRNFKLFELYKLQKCPRAGSGGLD